MGRPRQEQRDGIAVSQRERRASSQAEAQRSGAQAARSPLPSSVASLNEDSVNNANGGEGRLSGRGDAPSNTSPPTRHETPTGGADWLGVSAYASWDWKAFVSLSDTLEQLKEIAQEAKGANSRPVINLPNGRRGIVHRAGVKHTGGSEGGVYFDWNIESEGIQYQIAKRPTPDARLPNIYVKAGSIPLMEWGHREVWARAKEVLAGLGATIERAVCSRVDLCCDLAEQEVSPFVRLMEQGRSIRRAVNWKPYYQYVDGTTGFECGEGLKLRIYDKLQETEHDPVKREILTRMRWGGRVPNAATRVEFCVRREHMREWSCDGVEDTFDKLPELAKWLTGSWFRLVRGKPDRKNRHQDRVTTHALWRTVQQEGFTWCGEAGPPLVKRTKRPDPQQLTQQVVGLLSSIAAMRGEEVRDRKHLETLVWLITEGIDVKQFAKRCTEKLDDLAKQAPGLESS